MFMLTGIMRKTLSCKLVLFIVAVLQVQGVCAAEISKERRSDIVTLLQMTGVEALGLQMGVTVANQMIDALTKENPEIPPPVVTAIKDEVNLVFTEDMPKLMTEIVPVYAKYFTQDEVKGLIAFYGTPLGKKSIEVMPAVMNECMRAGQAWGKRIEPGLVERLEARLKKEGFSEQK